MTTMQVVDRSELLRALEWAARENPQSQISHTDPRVQKFYQDRPAEALRLVNAHRRYQRIARAGLADAAPAPLKKGEQPLREAPRTARADESLLQTFTRLVEAAQREHEAVQREAAQPKRSYHPNDDPRKMSDAILQGVIALGEKLIAQNGRLADAADRELHEDCLAERSRRDGGKK